MRQSVFNYTVSQKSMNMLTQMPLLVLWLITIVHIKIQLIKVKRVKGGF